MAEWSGAFSTTSGTLGDAQASYSQIDDSVFKRVTAACWGYQGIAPSYLNELKATAAGANTVSVNTGGAMVDGKVYHNSAAVGVNIPSAVGAGNTRIDRIVVRCSWAGTDTAITRIAGTDAASPTAPAITQTTGTTYDIQICQVLVDTAGACTVTDERDFAEPAELALAVLGIAANTAIATWGAIAAASDHTVFQRHGTSTGFAAVQAGMFAASAVASADIGAGAVTVGKIGTGAITAGAYGAGSIAAGILATGAVTAGAYGANSIAVADIGTMIPGFLGRQGGSATDWSSVGTNDYESGINVRVQGGCILGYGYDTSVTFPVAFSQVPIVVVSAASDEYFACVTSITASGFTVKVWKYNGGTAGAPVHWLAIGSE